MLPFFAIGMPHGLDFLWLGFILVIFLGIIGVIIGIVSSVSGSKERQAKIRSLESRIEKLEGDKR